MTEIPDGSVPPEHAQTATAAVGAAEVKPTGAATQAVEEIELEPMRTDDEGVRVLPFPVTEQLAMKLDAQRRKLDSIDASMSGKQRYEAARRAGCFAAISKGAKDRSLESNRLFIPGSELSQNGNGEVRISSLKATLPVPAGLHVKNITFIRKAEASFSEVEGEVVQENPWRGQLEVKEGK
jgi:hypothetical protein